MGLFSFFTSGIKRRALAALLSTAEDELQKQLARATVDGVVVLTPAQAITIADSVIDRLRLRLGVDPSD